MKPLSLDGGLPFLLILTGILFGTPTRAEQLILEPSFSQNRAEGNKEKLSATQVASPPILITQTILNSLPSDFEDLPSPQNIQPSQTPLPEVSPLPPAEELIDLPQGVPEEDIIQPFDENTFTIEQFLIEGNTVFSTETLLEEISSYNNRPIRFGDILEARNRLTEKYVDSGYITSGAIFPPQPLKEGTVTFQIIEGQLENIQVLGTRRLHPSYISSRLDVRISSPLNINQLQEQLQLILLNPLVDNVSADLQAGSALGTNSLVIDIQEADSFALSYSLDNNRVPSVGSIRNQIRLSENNLLGFGDALSLGYGFTSGSDEWKANYTVPINPYNGTLQLRAELTDSNIVEDPFDVLDINSDSNLYEVTLRQPVVQTLSDEVELGITASYQTSQTSLGIDDIGPFPLSPGADSEGRTTISAIRFFQQWTQRTNKQVLALNSQFNVGLGVLGATVNETEPDSRFLSWRGQGQWLRELGPDTLFIFRGSVQLSMDSLLTSERLGLGGQYTVRGYRQDQLLTDNGLLASAEMRFPILKNREQDMQLQLTPFIDVGYGWNTDGVTPSDNTLIGIGTGLLFTMPNLTARLDYGIPLTSVGGNQDTLQEEGLYLTFTYSLF